MVEVVDAVLEVVVGVVVVAGVVVVGAAVEASGAPGTEPVVDGSESATSELPHAPIRSTAPAMRTVKRHRIRHTPFVSFKLPLLRCGRQDHSDHIGGPGRLPRDGRT